MPLAGGSVIHRPKPPRPVLHRNHPRASSLIFASAVGWKRGYTDRGAGDFGDRDDVTNVRGVWTLGAGGGQYLRDQGGWGIDNGDGATGDSSQEWNPSPLTRYDVPAPFSAMVSIRPDVVSASTTIPFFKRRAQPYGAAQAGWCFTGGPGNTYQFRFSDGATEITLQSTTAQNVNRIDLVAVKYDGTGTARLFVNGIQEDSVGTAGVLAGNPAAEKIKLLGLGPANERFPGFTDVAALWGRSLTGLEMRSMAVDRFEMWREDDDVPLTVADYQTFLQSF